MTLVTVIDGAALQRAVDRLQNAESYRSTGVVDDATREELHAAITRGMEFLDEFMPGWISKVDPVALNLGSPCQCILGQVDHNFYEAMLRAGHAEIDDRGIIQPDHHWARQHGFAASSSIDYEAWDALTDLWRECIAIREAFTHVEEAVKVSADEQYVTATE